MRRWLRAAAVLAAFWVLGAPARAEVKPNGLFTDNMVLQRDASCPVWGTADPGEEVEVALERRRVGGGEALGASTKAGRDGRWSVSLPMQKAGGPYTMTIGGKGKKTT